jgi:serine/threonine-protein kinase
MRADLLRAAAGRPVSAPPVMTEAERTAMMAPPPRTMMTQPQRPVARVAPNQRHGTQKRGSTALVVLITVLGMLALGVLGLGLYLANQTNDVRVPDLNGKTAAEANELLAQAGLTPNQQPANNPDLCPPANLNKIISQIPKANTEVSEGTEVTFQLCLPPDKSTVPPLAGKSQGEADALLKQHNLKAKFVEVDSKEPKGTVVSTDPVAGTTVVANSTVTVNISKFNQREVPDLTGLTESAAKQALASRGFNANNVQVRRQATSNDDEVDKVIRQDPGANKVVPQNTTIVIVLGQRQNNPPTQNPSQSGSASPD